MTAHNYFSKNCYLALLYQKKRILGLELQSGVWSGLGLGKVLNPMLDLNFRIYTVLEVNHKTIVARECVVHSLTLCKL